MDVVERSCPVAATELPALLAFVEDCGSQFLLPSPVIYKLLLVVEELFLNTIHHGGEQGRAAPVRLALHREGGTVSLRYEDAAAAYNPFAHRDDSALALPVALRPVGQLGVILINGFASHASHARVADRNCIEIRVDC